jgi:hypothetical protein
MSGALGGVHQAIAAALVARAVAAYEAQDWPSALALYGQIRGSYPAIAGELACATIMRHCEIEAADDAALDQLGDEVDQGEAPAVLAHLVNRLRLRSLELCRLGHHRRASCLLRVIAPFDRAIGDVYAADILTRRSSCSDYLRPPVGEVAPPRFLLEQVSRLPVETVKRRFEGKRLLLVRRYSYMSNSGRHYESQDNKMRTATSFGFVVREFNTAALPGPDTDNYAASLRRAIVEFRPDVLYYDELFMSGVSSQPGRAEEIAQVLEDARRHQGVRVVKGYTDVWYVAAFMPDTLFQHLGVCFDLVFHTHSDILDRGSDAEKSAVFCFPDPCVPIETTVAAGSVSRAGFVGSVTHINIARLVWWAELMRAGLPVDFIGTDPVAAEQRSDVEYVNLLGMYQLSLNFALRPTGARIMTGRAVQVPLSGGVLVEENNLDTPYFLTPGVHYVPFETLPDLGDIVPALLADEARRKQLAAASRAWVEKYFTGDYFWAGLLTRLYR